MINAVDVMVYKRLWSIRFGRPPWLSLFGKMSLTGLMYSLPFKLELFSNHLILGCYVPAIWKLPKPVILPITRASLAAKYVILQFWKSCSLLITENWVEDLLDLLLKEFSCTPGERNQKKLIQLGNLLYNCSIIECYSFAGVSPMYIKSFSSLYIFFHYPKNIKVVFCPPNWIVFC